MPDSPETAQTLLAIDLGLKAGFAVYDERGELIAYRSTRFPSTAAMKKASWGILREVEGLTAVVVEGDRNLAAIWRKVAEKQGVAIRSVAPEVWRAELLLPRERRSSADAKKAAFVLADAVIRDSDVPAPTGDLTSDVAEAVLIGLWAAVDRGWREPVPR